MRDSFSGVFLKLHITVERPEHDGYCSDPGDIEMCRKEYKIRVPIWKLSPKVWKNIDTREEEYTGKFDKELYTEIIKLDFIPHKNILRRALHNNYEGVAYRETGCDNGSGYCGAHGYIRIDHALTY